MQVVSRRVTKCTSAETNYCPLNDFCQSQRSQACKNEVEVDEVVRAREARQVVLEDVVRPEGEVADSREVVLVVADEADLVLVEDLADEEGAVVLLAGEEVEDFDLEHYMYFRSSLVCTLFFAQLSALPPSTSTLTIYESANLP